MTAVEAGDCTRCPRLASFLGKLRADEPSLFNRPVPSCGDADARLLVVGLAPGLRGANRTGRPFTGDFAGEMLFLALREFGFLKERHAQNGDDRPDLVDCALSNAVRCVPPQNKPTALEVNTCRDFLVETISRAKYLRAVLCLGGVAHESTIVALGGRRGAFRFSHGARHAVSPAITLFDSYHCSRYNVNTGVLTEAMFHGVFADVRRYLDGRPADPRR